MTAEKDDMQAVTIWIKKDLVSRIETLAEKGELTRSRLITNIIEIGVEELEVMNKFGMWAAARVFRDFRERLQAGRSKKRAAKEKADS